jgi:hypothetical protein
LCVISSNSTKVDDPGLSSNWDLAKNSNDAYHLEILMLVRRADDLVEILTKSWHENGARIDVISCISVQPDGVHVEATTLAIRR